MSFSREIPTPLGRYLFSVDGNALTYGKTTMPLSGISGFSYGEERIDVYRPGTNKITGYNTHYEFFIYENTGRWIYINFIAHYITPASMMALYSEIERCVWHYIGYPMLHRAEQELRERKTIELAGCSLSPKGIVISRKLLFFRKKVFIPWENLDMKPNGQAMILKNEKHRGHQQKFDLIHDKNARVLKDLLYKILGDREFREAIGG